MASDSVLSFPSLHNFPAQSLVIVRISVFVLEFVLWILKCCHLQISRCPLDEVQSSAMGPLSLLHTYHSVIKTSFPISDFDSIPQAINKCCLHYTYHRQHFVSFTLGSEPFIVRSHGLRDAAAHDPVLSDSDSDSVTSDQEEGGKV